MLNVNNITKEYKSNDNKYRGYKNISFKVKKGEIICILGESGSGKSSLLKSLVGLEKPDFGEINFLNKKVKSAYVSQEYTLWPHLTVLENLILVPKLNTKIPINDLELEAKNLLKRFGLIGHKNNYPNELSGGQKQRVALLRAIMTKPDILFLDEITSALDPELTKSVLDVIMVLAKDGYSMVIVTHHLSFAILLANRVLFLKEGELIANEDSFTFFSTQKNPIISSFIIDISHYDNDIKVYKGREQFQAYHLNLIRQLSSNTIIYVAGAVGDRWYEPMGEFYNKYKNIRYERNITWKMLMYEHGNMEKKLFKENPYLNKFRIMPRSLKNPANYNVFKDKVIIQIFEKEPTIIEITNKEISRTYINFFDELWNTSKDYKYKL